MKNFIFEEKICLWFTGLYVNKNIKRTEFKLARTLSIYSTEQSDIRYVFLGGEIELAQND